MSLQIQVKWTGDYQFIARSGKGPGVIIDSTDGGSGATPMEMLLFGVAGCTGIDVVMILKKKRANLTDFRINISGERAEDYPQRFTRITIEYVLSGKGLKENDVKQAIELSEKKYCSATASLNAEISHSYRITEHD